MFGNSNSNVRSHHDPHTAVITTNDFDSIRHRASSTGREVSQKQKDREVLHKISQERLKHWPNTIEANRMKKEKAKLEKAEEEERLRRIIDAEEEALQKEKRRLAIERANKILYDETDRVKALHSRLMLSDVLKEREAQIALKGKMMASEEEDEKEWVEKQKHLLRKMDTEEEFKDTMMQTRSVQLQHARKEQLQDLRKRHERKIEELKIEGELTRQKAEADLRAERDAEMEKARRERLANIESMRANEYLKTLKDEERRREEAEEQKMQNFAKMKEKNLLERRHREAEKFRKKQEARAKMIDLQVKKLQDIQQQNAERLDKQVAEVQEKSEAALAAKEEKKRREMMEMHMSRQQQLRWREEKKTRGKATDEYYAGQLRLRNAELREEEQDIFNQQISKNQSHQNYLVKQMVLKQNIKDREREKEQLESHQTKQWMADDEEIFNSYASMCVDEWATMDKDTKPIQLLLSKKSKVTDLVLN